MKKGGKKLKTFFIIVVALAFLTAIFTAGYEDKPKDLNEIK
jgi:hypothetical protein